MFAKIRSEIRTLWHLMRKRLHVSAKDERAIVENFHKLYYESIHFGKTWHSTHWLGHKIVKCPLDMWVYQEILHETKPDLIVECGTFMGGSALYLASICDLLNKGRVVTIDIDRVEGRPEHPRIEYVCGSSTSKSVVDLVLERANGKESVMVILDSDHTMKHVLEELRLYSPMVSKGNYLIVEDGHFNGRPVNPEHGPGPAEAVEEFLKETSEFKPDKSREKFLMTFNPGGYLQRVAVSSKKDVQSDRDLAAAKS